MHTPEQRDQYPLCGAKKRKGGKCRQWAGWMTTHPGVGRCKYHGGSTPSHNQHALTVREKQRLVKLGEPMTDARPAAVLLGLLQASAGHVEWLHKEVGALDDLSDPEAVVLVRMYDEERTRAATVAKACLDAGVDEAVVRIAEEWAAHFTRLLEHIMLELRLTDGQRGAVGPAARKWWPVVLDASAEPDTSRDELIADALAADYIPSEWTKPGP